MYRLLQRNWRWAALPLGGLYLVLLAGQFRGVLATTYLDADTVSAPVIGELFGSAGAHANTVLGTFGWFSTLLFELGTKWLPFHRQIWEAAPYGLALAGVALVSWPVWLIAGRWAASLTAVLMVCAAPHTLHLLLSTTQHGPDWFCCALLAAFVVLLQRRAAGIRPAWLVAMTAVVGVIVGVNAASDVLVTIAGLIPFALAVLAGYAFARGPSTVRTIRAAVGLLVVVGITWATTRAVMSGWDVRAEQGLDTARFAGVDQISRNFRLWWESVAVLGNGDFFGRELSFSSAVAAAAGVLSIAAVVALPGWSRREVETRTLKTSPPVAADRLGFLVFWLSSAVLLTGAFLLSALPLDIHADRYLVGLVYATAALIPVLAAGRRRREAAALLGTCVFALSAVTSMAQDANTRNAGGFPSPALARRIADIAAANHLRYGYAGYWDAAPITWSTRFRVQVYPVSPCDRDQHLCRFDLHTISSWYTPHPGNGSFLLVDPALPLVRAPTPDLGRPTAVYRVGRITMFVYPYDLAAKIVS